MSDTTKPIKCPKCGCEPTLVKKLHRPAPTTIFCLCHKVKIDERLVSDAQYAEAWLVSQWVKEVLQFVNESALREIHDILYLETDEETGEAVYNADKEWDFPDAIDAIAEAVSKVIPRPE